MGTSIGADAGFAVYALDAADTVEQSYPSNSGFVGGTASSGNVAFDGAGHFYVAAADGLWKFSVGDPSSGSRIYSDPRDSAISVNGVAALDDGDLLIATIDDIDEITPSGTVVGTLGGSARFTNLRSIVADPDSATIYATMVGDSNHLFQLMKIDGTTGDVLAATTFRYGGDLAWTGTGRLIVTSATQVTEIFDLDLNALGTIGIGTADSVAVNVQ